MSYTIDCLKTHTAAACELLCDAVLNPLLDPGEVRTRTELKVNMKCISIRFPSEQLNDQKERLMMLLGTKDIQLTLLNEMLVRNSYKVGGIHRLGSYINS